MASSIEIAYSKLSDLTLYSKVKTGEKLSIGDIVPIVKLRYSEIVENWASYKQKLIERSSTYEDPFRLNQEIDKFNSLVKAQLAGAVTTPSETMLLSRFYSIFEALEISDANVSKQEQNSIDMEIKRVSAMTKTSFIEMRRIFAKARDEVADSIGGSDADYNRVFNRASVPKTLEKSIDGIQISADLQNAIKSVDTILANEQILKSTAAIDPFAFARENANNPEFNIGQYSSGVLVRMQYGETLQKLARRTLGNQDLWYDIAIANGLKPPYVDEIGSSLPLVSNGNASRLNVAKNGTGGLNRDRLYLGQIIILQSDTERFPDQRIIKSISEVPVSGEIVLELSGSQDLAKYKVSEKATIRVFSPQTINSNFYILIPSQAPLPKNKIQKATPWFLTNSGEDEKQAGVDLYIGESGDLQFTSAGDVQLRYGADNALQALIILLGTEAGSLTRHSRYGITSGIGELNSNFSTIRQKLAENVGSQILNDSRFDRLKTLEVELLSGASGYKVFIEVVLAGGNSVIPISFTINTDRK